MSAPPSRPRLHATRLWQRSLAALARGIAFRIEAMPRRKALLWGSRLGLLAYRAAKTPRRNAERNLRLAYGEALSPAERDALVRRTFAHWGKMTLDFLKSASYTPEEMEALIAERIGWDEYGMPALQAGKGLILVTAHLGNFEIFARYVAARKIPLTVVARDPDDPVFGAYVQRLRTSAGYQVVHKGVSARPLLAALREGEVIGILPDQNSGDLFVPFFDVPAGTPTGPAQLALRTGAPVIPAFCILRPDDTYRILVRPPIPLPAGEDRATQIQQIMQAINQEIEAAVREYPEQWLWLHNRWKSAFEEKNRARWPAGYSFEAIEPRWSGRSV